MNVDLLNEVCDRIMKYPKGFHMGNWLEIGECGTVACIAGHVVIVKKALELVESIEVEFFARYELGLSDEQAERLFFEGYWPKQFQKQYDYHVMDPWKQAEVAVARIQHFIKTEGRE